MTPTIFFRDSRGASAAEFALVLPLLLLLLFGIIDAGRFAWEFNRAEKATQVGARVAVVTNTIPSGLLSENYVLKTVGGVTLTQGDVIPAAALGDIKCTRTACTCTTTPCPPTPGTIDTTNFDNVLLKRMQYMKPDITAANVEIHYTGSGLGFAGDPDTTKPEISPIVTVKLVNLQFKPITTLLFATFTMPDFRTSLTAEDSNGSQSN